MKHFSLNTKSLKGISYGPALRPSRDWLVLVALAFIGLLMSVGWNLWTFNKVTEGQPIGTAPSSQEAENPAVDSVTRLFGERALEEARYKTEYRFVDPSTRPR